MPLLEVYLEIGKVQDSKERILICQVPHNYGSKDASEENILKRLQEFSFSSPNPVINSEHRKFAAVQYTYVLQECVNIKNENCDITTLSHYVFCLQREDGLTTHCISSLYPYFRSFYKLLSIISTASKEGKEDAIERLLALIANEKRMPQPGSPVTLHLGSSSGLPPVTIEHESPFCLPLMYENDHIAEFYRAFGLLQALSTTSKREASTLVKIFAHLLMERRFLVTSNEVRRFTSCCYALQTILYPLEWNYTFVPLLFPDPRIIDMVGLPQPYIMGIHKSHLQEALQISDSPEDCAIVLDVDTGQISPHYPGDIDILPKEVRIMMESRLSNAEMISRKGDYFCRIFMDALVLLIGDYSQFFIPNSTTGVAEFTWEKYQNHRPESDYKRFAEAVESKLGMIKMFILMRLEMVKAGRPIPFDDFERSLKDRALIVKESRVKMQHRIKQGAGKLVGTAKEGFKKLIPPRSQSRPTFTSAPEQFLPPMSHDDSSLPDTVEQTVTYDAPCIEAIENSVSEPEPVVIVEPVNKPPENDLIRWNSSDEDNLSDEEIGSFSIRRSLPPEVLQKADPLTLFDPLEKAKRGGNQFDKKPRSNSRNEKQQKEVIERVLALYSSTPNGRYANASPQSTYNPIVNPMTTEFSRLSVYEPSQFRQSTIFPGRMPVTFQPLAKHSATVAKSSNGNSSPFFPVSSARSSETSTTSSNSKNVPSSWTTFDD